MLLNKIQKINLRWLLLIFFIFFIDFISKQWIIKNFLFEESIKVFSFLNISYIRNSGIIFGFLANQEIWIFYILSIINIAIITILLILMNRLDNKNYFSKIAYSLIIGGALGNLLDRILYGAVIDFIDIYIYNLHWPVFNIADFFILIGTLLITWKSIFYSTYKNNK